MRYVPGLKLDWRGARHRFSDLMEVYETNYRLLTRLIPRLDSVQEREVSAVSDCLDLHLELVERHKYTTLISLTYLFDREGVAKQVAEPGVVIRLYHDAKVAEVFDCAACDEAMVTDAEGVRHGQADVAERKWTANLFLEKWLAFCLERGHRFPSPAHPSHQEAGLTPALADG